jgi:GNAT superfamily N-acetyltransferase
MQLQSCDILQVPGSADLAEKTAKLLSLLPAWFGIPEATAEYVHSATELPGYLACIGDDAVGVLLYRRHFLQSTEIHLIAVDPEFHRRGIGHRLVATLQEAQTQQGCLLLQVKTLGSAHPDAGYARTRAFYRNVGFIPVEETMDLWPGIPCLIMVKVCWPGPTGSWPASFGSAAELRPGLRGDRGEEVNQVAVGIKEQQ